MEILVKIFENFFINSKISKNFDLRQIFEKISTLVKIFEKFDFFSKISKNLNFNQIFETIRFR